MAIGLCSAQVLWMNRLSNYDIIAKAIQFFCDNSNVIYLSKNHMHHSRAKYINIKNHFIRDHILSGNIQIIFISIENQLANISTKPLLEERFFVI